MNIPDFFWKHWNPELFTFWFLVFFNYIWKSRNLGYSQSSHFDLKSLKIKIEPTSWPFLCLKRPFYGVSNDIFVVQIHPKMAEKAKCQFSWPLLWPWFLYLSEPSTIYEQFFTTAEKAFFHSLVSFRPNCSKKSQNCYLLHKPPSSGTENLK